jgi:hypothetical protein
MISLFGPYRTMSPEHAIDVSSIFDVVVTIESNKHTVFLMTGPDVCMEVSEIGMVNRIPRCQFR